MRNALLQPRLRSRGLFVFPATDGGSEGAATAGEDSETYPAGACAGRRKFGRILAPRSMAPIAALAIPAPGFFARQAYRRLANRGSWERYPWRASWCGTLGAVRGFFVGPLLLLFDCRRRWGRCDGRRIFDGICRKSHAPSGAIPASARTHAARSLAPVADSAIRLLRFCMGQGRPRLSGRGAAASITIALFLIRSPRLQPRLRLWGLIVRPWHLAVVWGPPLFARYLPSAP